MRERIHAFEKVRMRGSSRVGRIVWVGKVGYQEQLVSQTQPQTRLECAVQPLSRQWPASNRAADPPDVQAVRLRPRRPAGV